MTSVERRAERASTQDWEVEPFSIETRPDRQRVVVVPRGELDIATVGELAEEIDELVARGFDRVVVDLRDISFMDSSGLHLFVREAARTDAQVTLIDGAPVVRRVIDLAGLRHLLRFEGPS